MMRNIRNTGSILLVFLLIVATGGVSIYHHFCHCAGAISASVFIEASCDHENSSTPASCCSLDETHSCCMEEPASDTKSACQKDDCCQNSSQFLKISDSFQPGFEKISLKPFVIVSALLFFNIPADDNTIPSVNLFNADLPPPDSGRQIITAIHQLKIAPKLV